MRLIKADEGTTLYRPDPPAWHRRAALLLPLAVAALVALVYWLKGGA